ncbi:MAG: rhodanese [Planctomycetaceae bacterium]|nr:rhodanese [Planctomycetaceae bacterium]
MTTNHPWEIAPEELRSLRQDGESPLVIDCREAEEVEIASIDGARHIPMGEIKSHLPDLEDHADDLVVVLCHHGVRSLRVVAFLREEGFSEARSLAGGIDRWSIEIDGDVPRY